MFGKEGRGSEENAISMATSPSTAAYCVEFIPGRGCCAHLPDWLHEAIEFEGDQMPVFTAKITESLRHMTVVDGDEATAEVAGEAVPASSPSAEAEMLNGGSVASTTASTMKSPAATSVSATADASSIAVDANAGTAPMGGSACASVLDGDIGGGGGGGAMAEDEEGKSSCSSGTSALPMQASSADEIVPKAMLISNEEMNGLAGSSSTTLATVFSPQPTNASRHSISAAFSPFIAASAKKGGASIAPPSTQARRSARLKRYDSLASPDGALVYRKSPSA